MTLLTDHAASVLGRADQGGDGEIQARSFIDDSEIRDLAARAHAIAACLDAAVLDDSEPGRLEVLRAIYLLARRSLAVLA